MSEKTDQPHPEQDGPESAHQAVITIIEVISEKIMLLEASDLVELGSVHGELEKLQEVAGHQSGEATKLMQSSADLLERVIMREVEDSAGAMDLFRRCVSAIQAMVGENHAPKDVLKDPEVAQLAISIEAAAESSSIKDDKQGDVPAEIIGVIQLDTDADLLAEFVSESGEHLDAIEEQLLILEKAPEDSEAINALFRAFHTIKGIAGFLDLRQIGELSHEAETLLDKARRRELTLSPNTFDIIFTTRDKLEEMIRHVEEAVGEGGHYKSVEGVARLITQIQACIPGHAEKKNDDVQSNFQGAFSKLEAVEAEENLTPEVPEPLPASVPEATSTSTQLLKTPPLESTATDTGPSGKKKSVKENVRVDADRLDKLVDTIGELVIAQAMVHQSEEWSFNEGSNLPKVLNQMDKITRELQELAMSLRMVPIKPTFQKMGRLVRDVSKKLNKTVHFTTSGEETELDKSVVDAIGDPLVHMVRNAVDHGIESPEDRVKSGKNPEGSVELKAYHQGGSIYIEIVDDGKGLDRDAILKKGIERGLVRENDNLSDNEVYNLIFEAGFSTAAQITDVSGRGVGMDVVKKNIQALRGRVDIRSEKGKGSVFSIRLPLTLAIIEGMVVQVGPEKYIFPTMSIVRMIRPEPEQLSTVLKRGELLKVGDQLIPIYHLSSMFNIEDACKNPCEASVVIVENDGKQYAFIVDELLGQQQIVIKPLGGMLKKTAGLSGGAIMPDGRVGLILDIAGLVRVANQQSTEEPIELEVAA